jgi:agmatine deiminase
MIKKMQIVMITLLSILSSCKQEQDYKPTLDTTIQYIIPEESAPHEGTWLQWPHQYQYGSTYRNRLDATWINMTKALVEGEKVHIIAYDAAEEERIKGLLTEAGVSLSHIDFNNYPTDDVWVRDNGPIYVHDRQGQLVIEDWGFNGWGEKADYQNCDQIPAKIANNQAFKRIDLNNLMINEGGAIEIDGRGTLLATKSAILNNNRNPGMTQRQAEEIFTKYLGTKHFIWLDGKAGLEITDMHIDGFARFANPGTIVTMGEEDLLEWEVSAKDIRTLYAAKDVQNKPYNLVKLPLTVSNVVTTYGKNLGYRGSYVNYYIANNCVLVPNYNDPNDAVANGLIQRLYPDRKLIGIDVRNLYANGGMIHCVTQQQPQ